jgi:hypothetical protein
MTDTPNDDTPGFVAEEPVHCYTCFRLIRPGQDPPSGPRKRRS